MRNTIATVLAALALLGCKPAAGGDGGQPNPSPPPESPAVKGTWVEVRRKGMLVFPSAVGTF